MMMLAEALYRLEEYPLSAQAYEVYLSHFSNDLDAQFRLGVSYLSAASYAKAERQFSRVLQSSPERAEANYFLGLALVETKDHDRAFRHFEAELKLNPSSYQSMTQLAFLEHSRGDSAKCAEWLAKAAALNAGWPEMHFVYGLLHNRQGRYELAAKSLERVVSENPRHIKAHFQLSLAYRRLGNEAEAAEHLGIYNRLLEAHRAKSLGDDPRRK
jgi:tetratricopeptide (TPR) repeat protein